MKSRLINVTHLALRTFFQTIPPLATVDHIDENHKNNDIRNLQWLSNADNASKSRRLTPRSTGWQKSKKVWLLDGKEGNRVRLFKSVTEACNEFNLKTGSISQSATSRGHLAAGGKYFQYEEPPDLEGEVWVTSDALDTVLNQKVRPEHRKIRVSNFGRVINNGIKTVGGFHKRNGRYRQMKCFGKKYKVHQLIYMGFANKPAPTKETKNEHGELLEICHLDSAPRDSEGCCLNYPQYLRLGTHGENLKEYHSVGKFRE